MTQQATNNLHRVISWVEVSTKQMDRPDRFAHLWDNEHVQRLVQHTLNRWVYSPDGIGGGWLMFHKASDVPQVIHQIVLGGGYCDGVYELSVRKRHNVKTWLKNQTLTVLSSGTLDALEIEIDEGDLGFTAFELGQERYEQMLLERGLLTLTELNEAKSILASGKVSMLQQVQFVSDENAAVAEYGVSC